MILIHVCFSSGSALPVRMPLALRPSRVDLPERVQDLGGQGAVRGPSLKDHHEPALDGTGDAVCSLC